MELRNSKFVKEVSVIDPDTNNEVNISIYKHENGGMFGIDSSFIEQEMDEETDFISDPFDLDREDLVWLK